MRRSAIAALLFALLAAPGIAAAEGPSGSTEDEGREVKCAEGTDTPGGRIYAGSNGAEACSDDSASPDGRIIVDFAGKYAAVDGDATNGSNGDGFVRLDASGASCGNNQAHDSSKGPGGSCP